MRYRITCSRSCTFYIRSRWYGQYEYMLVVHSLRTVNWLSTLTGHFSTLNNSLSTPTVDIEPHLNIHIPYTVTCIRISNKLSYWQITSTFSLTVKKITLWWVLHVLLVWHQVAITLYLDLPCQLSLACTFTCTACVKLVPREPAKGNGAHDKRYITVTLIN